MYDAKRSTPASESLVAGSGVVLTGEESGTIALNPTVLRYHRQLIGARA